MHDIGHDRGPPHRAPPFCLSLASRNFNASRGADEVVQILADDIPPPIAEFFLKRPLSVLPKGHCAPQARSSLPCNLPAPTSSPSSAPPPHSSVHSHPPQIP